MRLKIFFAAALIALWLAGCATPATRPANTVDAPALVATKEELALYPNLALFDIPAGSFQYTCDEIDRTGEYILRRIAFPSPYESPVPRNNTVYAEYYEPTGDGPFPAVIVLHHVANEFTATRMMCREFARNGIAALMPMMAYYGERRPAAAMPHQPYYIGEDAVRQTVMDIRRARQLLESFADIDRDRISLAGLSLGAIVGGLAAGVDGHFHRCVLIMGGGNLADIIWQSPIAADFKKQYEENGGTLEKLREEFAPVEPTAYAARVKTASVLMLNMKDDNWVPPAATTALWEALGKPEILWCPGAHLGILLYWPDVMDRAVKHIKGPK